MKTINLEPVTWSRTFTEQDVRAFATISGDAGQHHVEPDRSGRYVVHGLLTATLPTKLGGDMNFLAQTMEFEFLRIVRTGDDITATGWVSEVLGDHDLGNKVTLSFECVNQDGKTVMRGSSTGIIPG